MDVDLARLPTGTAGWLALANYALALGDLSEVDYLELKGPLSFTERQPRKRSAVVLTRAILGMANRMPDLAEKHLSGAGVIFVGISGQTLVGAEDVDGAVLRDAIQPYVGEDGPRWDYQFIDHPDGRIMAIVVDPPQWGDRAHPCQKDYTDDETKLAVRDGDVFVRVPGKTRPASSYDLSQLDVRRSKAPHTGAQLRVSYAGMFDRTSRANVEELISDIADSQADMLFDSAPNQTSASIYSPLFKTAMLAEDRTPDQFRAEVEEWRDECREATARVATEFLRHTLEHGSFEVTNESDRYLENVRVQVTLPPEVEVLIASDTNYCDHGGQFDALQLLPDRPAKYDRWSPHRLDMLSNLVMPRVPSTTVTKRTRNVHIEQADDGCVLSWFVGDLPSRAQVKVGEQFAVFISENLRAHHHGATSGDHPGMATHISGQWQVTARGVHHVFEGDLTLECRQGPGEVAMWARSEA